MLLEYVVESPPVTNNTNPLKHSKTLEQKVRKLRKTQKLNNLNLFQQKEKNHKLRENLFKKSMF